MSQSRNPREWIESSFPTKTISGIKVVYDEDNYKSRFYSIKWLAQAFGEQIATYDSPREQIIEECERCGYSELQDIFEYEES